MNRYHAKQTVDLSGQTLMPGFVDSHTHISGDAQRYIDLTEVSSIVEIQALVRGKAALLGSGAWITGYGWSEDELMERRKPTRYDLDVAAPDNPVVLTRAGAHSAVASSLLWRLRISTQILPTLRAVIERGPTGELNGIVRERRPDCSWCLRHRRRTNVAANLTACSLRALPVSPMRKTRRTIAAGRPFTLRSSPLTQSKAAV